MQQIDNKFISQKVLEHLNQFNWRKWLCDNRDGDIFLEYLLRLHKKMHWDACASFSTL